MERLFDVARGEGLEVGLESAEELLDQKEDVLDSQTVVEEYDVYGAENEVVELADRDINAGSMEDAIERYVNSIGEDAEISYSPSSLFSRSAIEIQGDNKLYKITPTSAPLVDPLDTVASAISTLNNTYDKLT